MSFARPHRSLWVIPLLIGLTACYYAEALSSFGVLSFRDLARYFYPLRLFTVTTFISGSIPLWDPYIFCGVPHLAFQQSVVFYPLSIIYYLMPFDRAFNVFLVAHVFLAGFFTFLLARRWGFSDAAALISAITFMFGGYLLSMVNLATTLSSCIWLPLILYFFDAALTARSVRAALGAALAYGVMFLGGEPSIFYMTAWVIGIYALFFWRADPARRPFREVASITGLVMVAATLLAAVQLIPFLELMGYADRTVLRGAYETVTRWSVSLKDTFDLFIPFLARSDFSKEGYWKEQNWALVIYTGVFSILLLVFSLRRIREWRIRFLWAAAFLFLAIAYGSNAPVYRALYGIIPGFNVVRYPARFLYPTIVALALLSGAGYGAYEAGRSDRTKRGAGSSHLFLAVLGISSIAFFALSWYRPALIAAAHRFCMDHPGWANDGRLLFSMIAALVNVDRFLGFFVGGGLILFLGTRLPVRQGVITFGFLGLLVADLFSAVPLPLTVMTDRTTITEATTTTAYLRQDPARFRFFVSPKAREENLFLRGQSYEEAIRAMKEMLTANWPIIDGLYDTGGYDSIRLARYSNLMALVETAGSPSATQVLNMLNAKYLISTEKLDAAAYRPIYHRDRMYLYENTEVLPRAYLVGSYTVLSSEAAIAARFKSKDFDPRREVILEEDPGVRLQDQGDGAEGEGTAITRYAPNEVTLRVTAAAPKFLVLADTYYPGWKAFVDGRREKIYKANFVLRAVRIEPGEHVVRFIFDPFSFKLGAAISLATLLAIIFFLLRPSRPTKT